MNKEINSNGFGYIDLGLPSGTLWATCNVGADKPTDYGLYFQWGDTQGCSIDQIGIERGQKKFFWTDYKFNPSGDRETFTKYTNSGATLELEDDAANVNMGGDWHMPTPTQIRELINETDNTWTTQDGVNGRLFTSKKNGKSIFIPAAGYVSNGSLQYGGSEAVVWSSMLVAYVFYNGQYLGFYSYNVSLDDYYRCCGFSVRGVIG